MTDEQIIEKMAHAMADAVKDPSWSHYVKPARAAFWVAKDHLAPTETEQARAGDAEPSDG
jgi:hypothetical protein